MEQNSALWHILANAAWVAKRMGLELHKNYRMEFFPNNNYELLENIPMVNQYSMLTCNNFVELPM